jgi:hypothetical protein
MSNAYTKHPASFGDIEVDSDNVEYIGDTLANSGSNYGEKLTEVLEKMDEAIDNFVPTGLDADFIEVTSVVFNTEITSSGTLTAALQQIINKCVVYADKYTQTEADDKFLKKITSVDLVSALSYSISASSEFLDPIVYRFYGNNASGTKNMIVIPSGTPTANMYIDFILDFEDIQATSSLTIFGSSVSIEMLSTMCFVRMYYDGSLWRMFVSPSFDTDNVLDYGRINDFDTGVSANADVAASKDVTEHITVSQSVDLNEIDDKVGFLTVSQAVDLDTLEGDVAANVAKLATIEANADVTDAANVASAGAVMTTGGNTVTGDQNYTGAVLQVATPINGSDAVTKDYCDFNRVVTNQVFLTTSNILNLTTSAIELVPAQGNQTVIDVLSVGFYYDYGTSAFTGGASLDVHFQGGSNIFEQDEALIQGTSDAFSLAERKSGSITALSNTAVQLSTGSAFSAGTNSSLTCVVKYVVQDFS